MTHLKGEFLTSLPPPGAIQAILEPDSNREVCGWPIERWPCGRFWQCWNGSAEGESSTGRGAPSIRFLEPSLGETSHPGLPRLHPLFSGHTHGHWLALACIPLLREKTIRLSLLDFLIRTGLDV